MLLSAGDDYSDTSGALSFSNSDTEQCVDIPLTIDRIAEHEEMFQVALSTNFPRVNLDLPSIDVIIVDTSSKLYIRRDMED